MTQPPGPPSGPPPAAFPPPSPPAPGRGNGPLIIVLVAAVAVAVLLIGGAVYVVWPRGDDSGALSGPVDLREPLTFTLVAQESAPPCAAGALAGADGSTCFTMGSDKLTVRRLERVEAQSPDPGRGRQGWGVTLTLTSADTAGFGELTRKAAAGNADGLPSGKMAMLVGGALVSDPMQVLQPITGGQVEITGPADRFDRSYVDGLVQRMTGRKP